jgi:glycosyl transferase family 87
MAQATTRRPGAGASPHRDAAASPVASTSTLAALLEPAAIRRIGTSGLILVVAIFAVVRLLDVYPWNDRLFDQWAYWSTRFGMDYSLAHPGESGAYLYSPAFAQLIRPLTVLPLTVFMAVWTVLIAAVFYWLAGWRAFFVGLLAPVAMSISIGQLDVLMAAVIVLGFRWPAVWLLPFITKLTPGIGVLWYAARGEWRSLGIALGATAAVVGMSMALAPQAWQGWIEMILRFETPTSANGVFLPVPLFVRLPLVALLIVWGARTSRRWVLPIGVALALPTVWLNTPTILVAILPLVALGADSPAGRWLRAEEGTEAPALQRLRRRLRWAGLVVRREIAAMLAPLQSRRSNGWRGLIGW